MLLIFYTRIFFHLLKLLKGIAFFAVVHCSFFPLIYKFLYWNIFATPKAAPAATAPISITRKAPAHG